MGELVLGEQVAAMMTRRALMSVLGAGLASGSAGSSRRPNLLIILADDQGWGDLSIHGNKNLKTPNIDSLGRDGALFERFYVCAVCAPTRAEYLTGRYHARGGVRGVAAGAERLNPDEKTIADTFKAAGYATGAFGKWHNGSQWPYHPNARGFGEYYGFTSGHIGHYIDADLERNGQPVRGKGYLPDDLTSHAIKFIEKNKSASFFCYLALNTPHSPMQVPDAYFRKFDGAQVSMRSADPSAEDLAMTRAALAMCENIDFNVGRVLRKVEELGIAKDTIVVYFSDNGPNSWRWNGEMKGRKGSLDEGGLRSPLLIRWPGHISPGRRVPQIAAAIDLLPTFADLAGAPVAGTKPLDGRSLKPLLLGTSGDWADRTIFTSQGNRVSARTQRYRLDADQRLFDIEADPSQKKDVAAEQPEVAERLRRAVLRWKAEVQPGGKDERPFTVGYATRTTLPAGEGIPHGGIRRSSIHPNSSFFTNWTNVQDRMTWDIEVARSAAYQATIFYTCRSQDVDAEIELRCGSSAVRTKLAEPYDPPLIGGAEDRVKRQESYVKRFRALPLGNIRLEAGRGTLTLQAIKVPGSQVADVLSVVLTMSPAERISRKHP